MAGRLPLTQAGTLNDDAWAVPPHSRTVLNPITARYAAVLTVQNEGPRLERQLTRMQSLSGICDIVIADGRTTDGSTRDELLASRRVHAVLRLTGPGGFSSSLRTGLAYAMRSGFAGVVLLNGNDKDDPAAIPAFVRELDAGAGYVQGSRYLPGGEAINTPRARDLLIKLVHRPLFNLISGGRFTDTTNGFRAFSRAVLLDPRVQPWRDAFAHYELEYYLAWAACRFGFRTTEIPVTRAYPLAGKVPTKITLIRGHWEMLKPLVMLAFRRY